MKIIIIFLLFIATHHSSLAQKVLSGIVKDLQSKEVIINAMVYNKQNATYTDIYGRFRLYYSLENDSIIIEDIAYHRKSIAINEIQDKELTIIFLEEKSYQAEIIQVESNIKHLAIQKIEAGLSVIHMKNMKEFPTMGGESDILRMAQLKNGVHIGKDLSNAFYVRGARNDHNMILLDGMELFNPSHLGAFLSLFNSDAVKQVEFYKGSVPVQYSGRLGSVLNVSMKDGNQNETHFSGGISMLSTQLLIEGPHSDFGSYLFSMRHAYYDYIIWLISKSGNFDQNDQERLNDSKLQFSDYLFKTNYMLSENHRLILNQSYATDDIDLLNKKNKSDFYSNWVNSGTQIRVNSIWSSHFFSELSVKQIYYKSKFKEENYYPFIYRNTELKKQSVTFQGNYFYNSNTQLFIGFEYSANSFHNDLYKNEVYSENSIENSPHLTMYSNYATEIINRLEISMGLRWNHLQYDKQAIWEPRIAAKYKLSENDQLKFSYDKIYQTIHSLTVSQLEDPSAFYFHVNQDLKSSYSQSFIFSYEKEFDNYFIQLEFYHRKIHNLTMLSNSINDLSMAEVLEKTAIGMGSSFGFDATLERSSGRISGWINYSYNSTLYQFDKLISGKSFKPKFHKPHQLNIVANYNFKEHSKFGFLAQISSGFLLTSPTNRYIHHGQILYEYNDLNNMRSPLNWRVDVNYRYLFSLWKGKWEMALSIYNLLNSPNPIFVSTNGAKIEYQTLGMIPTIGLKFYY